MATRGETEAESSRSRFVSPRKARACALLGCALSTCPLSGPLSACALSSSLRVDASGQGLLASLPSVSAICQCRQRLAVAPMLCPLAGWSGSSVGPGLISFCTRQYSIKWNQCGARMLGANAEANARGMPMLLGKLLDRSRSGWIFFFRNEWT